jgi:hypothetical protein
MGEIFPFLHTLNLCIKWSIFSVWSPSVNNYKSILLCEYIQRNWRREFTTKEPIGKCWQYYVLMVWAFSEDIPMHFLCCEDIAGKWTSHWLMITLLVKLRALEEWPEKQLYIITSCDQINKHRYQAELKISVNGMGFDRFNSVPCEIICYTI